MLAAIVLGILWLNCLMMAGLVATNGGPWWAAAGLAGLPAWTLLALVAIGVVFDVIGKAVSWITWLMRRCFRGA